MKRTLALSKETLTELTTEDLGSVVAGVYSDVCSCEAVSCITNDKNLTQLLRTYNCTGTEL